MSNQSVSYLQPDFELGKYTIKGLLGRGGMAEVYRAYNPDLAQDVAIKVLNPNFVNSEEASSRFRREAQAIASLSHPNIVRVYDFAVQDHFHYMVMELLEGVVLDDLMQEYPRGMPYERIVNYFGQLANAVNYAHEQGVIHRDIKPSNMIVVEERLVLTDFGLAKMIGQASLTMTGTSSGTPAYMAPEQAAGETITNQTDIYTLGVVLYELATGRVPFQGDTFANVLIKHLKEAPKRPTEVNEEINPVLEPVILRAMAKQPDLRYDTVDQMRKEMSSTPDEISKETMKISTQVMEALTSPYFEGSSTIIGLPISDPAVTLADLTQQKTEKRRWQAISGIGIVLVILLAGAFIMAQLSDDNNLAGDNNSVVDVAAPDGMVYVSDGSFQMGSAQGGDNERPIHEVFVSSFFMDKYEVTNQDYYVFVEETGFFPEPAVWERAEESIWQLEGSEVYVVGDLNDRWSYNGTNISETENSSVIVNLNADEETGMIVVEFDGTIQAEDGIEYEGRIRIEHEVFRASANFNEGGVGDHVLMHGTSGQESSSLPEVVSPIATWGTAHLYVDDEEVYPDLGAHFMLLGGIRDDELRILKSDGSCCYSSLSPGSGLIDDTTHQMTLFLFKGSAGGSYATVNPGAIGQPEQNVWLNIHVQQVEILERPAEELSKYEDGTENMPVTGVTWNAAQAYCEWNNQRLPTEAEWEYAARSSRNTLYPWGNEQTVNGTIPANVIEGTGLQDVGSFADGISSSGVYDMAGNAWEWVSDWYSEDYYANSEAENPLGSRSGTERIVRGGSYLQLDPSGIIEFRSTHRRAVDPALQLDDVGFRCASDYFEVEVTPED